MNPIDDPYASTLTRCLPFSVKDIREIALAHLGLTADELAALVPAQRAIIAAYREMPLLAEILAAALNDRYVAYLQDRLVSTRADMDLLIALYGKEAYKLCLHFGTNPEARALFEHPDFTPVIDDLPEDERAQVRAFQHQWQEERRARRDALRGTKSLSQMPCEPGAAEVIAERPAAEP